MTQPSSKHVRIVYFPFASRFKVNHTSSAHSEISQYCGRLPLFAGQTTTTPATTCRLLWLTDTGRAVQCSNRTRIDGVVNVGCVCVWFTTKHILNSTHIRDTSTNNGNNKMDRGGGWPKFKKNGTHTSSSMMTAIMMMSLKSGLINNARARARIYGFMCQSQSLNRSTGV